MLFILKDLAPSDFDTTAADIACSWKFNFRGYRSNGTRFIPKSVTMLKAYRSRFLLASGLIKQDELESSGSQFHDTQSNWLTELG